MKALLLNGPWHLRTLEISALWPSIVTPVPLPNGYHLGVSFETPYFPVYETVVYHKHQGKVGGFALYVAEEDE